MHRIDRLTGSQLMRLWGVSSWPNVDGDYFLWNGAAVFALRDRGDYVEIHMAMKKGERHKCREAVSDALSVIGKREVHALIESQYKHVRNLAKNMGFTHHSEFEGLRKDGSVTKVIKMVRYI
nr:hypothetical protein [uncultured Vibrio sp.]